MKLLIGFALGAVCAAAAMFYLPGHGLPTREAQTIPGAVVNAASVNMPASVAALPQGSATPPPVLVQTASVPEPTVPSAPSTSSVAAAAPAEVLERPSSATSDLLIPVAGVKPGDLTDTFTQARGDGRVHDAIDIMAPRGTPVVAANDGRVVKLFTSKPGGLTVYQFDPEDRVVYYYAHLDGYAAGLAEGKMLHRGDPVGFVGSTGNASADAPHLHFEVEILGPEKQWWHATSINPYGLFAGQQPTHAAATTPP